MLSSPSHDDEHDSKDTTGSDAVSSPRHPLIAQSSASSASPSQGTSSPHTHPHLSAATTTYQHHHQSQGPPQPHDDSLPRPKQKRVRPPCPPSGPPLRPLTRLAAEQTDAELQRMCGPENKGTQVGEASSIPGTAPLISVQCDRGRPTCEACVKRGSYCRYSEVAEILHNNPSVRPAPGQLVAPLTRPSRTHSEKASKSRKHAKPKDDQPLQHPAQASQQSVDRVSIASITNPEAVSHEPGSFQRSRGISP